MATTVDTLLVRIEADMRDVRRDLASLEKRTETASRSISKSMNRIGTVTQAVIGGVLVQQFARGIMSLTNFASDMEEMSAMSEAVFGGFVTSVRNQLEEFGTAVGRSSFELEAMAASVQDTFVPLGFARGTAADLSVQLTKLAVDVGSFKNELETDVMASFQSALVGNHEAVRRFGIVITEAELKNELLRMGIKKAAKDVDAQTKVQARLNLILAGTVDAQGDAAKTADSYANLTRALDAEVKLLAKDLGDQLLPIMKSLVITTTAVIKEFRQFFRAIGFISTAHDDFVKNLKRVKEAEEDVAKAQEKLAKSPNYMPHIVAARKANDELTAALKEQDEILDPLINARIEASKATNDNAAATSNLTEEETKAEKALKSLRLELAMLKTGREDQTGVSADLLKLEAELGDEYFVISKKLKSLLIMINNEKEAQEAAAEAAEKHADKLKEVADASEEVTKLIKKAAQAQRNEMTAAFLEGNEEIKTYRDLVKSLQHENELLQQSIDGVSEAEMLANKIIRDNNLEHTTQQKTIRELIKTYFELQDSIQLSNEAIDQAAKDTIIMADSFGLITEEIEKFNKKAKEIDPMTKEMNSALASMSRGISDSFADMVVSGKMNLDSLRDVFSSFVRTMISKAIELAVINRIMNSVFNLRGTSGELPEIGAKAGGGRISGPTIVGERGPELFVPSSAGVIKNNMDTRNILGGGGGAVVNQVINIDAGVSQTVRAEMMTMLPMFKSSAMEAIIDSRRRGGQVATAFGA